MVTAEAESEFHIKMKISNVCNCAFPEWYSKFKTITTESILIPLPESFLTYLHTDGLVLPNSSTHGVYGKANNLIMDGDVEDEDLRDDELMRMYESDWSTGCSTLIAESPDFGEFDLKVKAAIKTLGGRVFPKLNWSSPKDASWIAFDKSLMCTCPSDVYLLLKSSQFISHDLDQPFDQCEDYQKDALLPSLTYTLVLRKWEPPNPASEFRCFVHNNKLIGVCQRNANKFYPHIIVNKNVVLEDICEFVKIHIAEKFVETNYVVDVVHVKQGHVILIDFNPFGPVTDALMFTWSELSDLITQIKELPCFRCVESEEGVQCSDYANFAFPQDIQDLAAGEDPYKFMDWMKIIKNTRAAVC
ncbi:cell division cycle protein 123 homolog isoform X2 [Biomphalaria glabrata]|uniref:Cell division cycle protein 123 homolog isoform X2 n=1 Tax=Biomphalaria glabrata TaxID=6526 RepID=A0A9W3A5G0_BIOGL|nr:cell division cycle protein 123 homolog isoform X2 [Biomphalaria glabrata]